MPAVSTTNKISMGTEKSLTGLHPNKKNQGKVPKRVNKAEREKLKRDHLNKLFLSLADTLELSEQNNGKASILGETTRVVKDLLDQIESLKRENAALLSESQYVTGEKNELQDENSALQVHIGELKSVLKERVIQSNLDLNVPPIESQEPQLTSYLPGDCLNLPIGDPSLHQAPMLNPVFVIPVCPDFQVNQGPDSATKPISNVSKPHPRYPTPADSWPFQLLEKQSEVGKELQCSHRKQVLGNVCL